MSIKLTDARAADRPRRRARIGLILALVAVLIAIVVAVVVSQQDKPLAELRIRDQRVSVRTPGKDFVPGLEGQALEAGNAVRTNDEGQAQVDFFDGSLTRLDASTTFVVRELQDNPQGRRISLKLDAGRTWNRVERLTSSQDRYELGGGNAVATVRGTTFIADGRQAPIWYYIGQEGETDLSSSGQNLLLGRNDCVRVDEDGMRRCTDHEFQALMDDWVRENQGLDALAAATTPTPSPTATPTVDARPGGRARPPATESTPTPAEQTRRPPVQNTEDPNQDDEQQTDDPSTDAPTDEPPTDPPTDEPEDEGESPPSFES